MCVGGGACAEMYFRTYSVIRNPGGTETETMEPSMEQTGQGQIER